MIILSRHATRYLPTCLALLLSITACSPAAKRTLPEALTRAVPWGALQPGEQLLYDAAHPNYDAILKARTGRIQSATEGRIPLRMLAISGGGIRGNYGAGVLTGWSQSGKRPEFDVVTGVSVGALMAPFVFLGSAYDKQLRESAVEAVTILSSKKARPKLFRTGSAYVGEAFDDLARRHFNDALIHAVAVQYLRGRRLFVGTTNLDGQEFTVWDLGMIAASDRPDKAEVFRKALIASASVPMLFPPVMFKVDTPAGADEQLHIDGGMTNNVFMVDYDGNWERVLREMELDSDDFCVDGYALHNGYLDERPLKPPVENRMVPVIGATVETLMSTNAANGIYKLWLSAMVTGTRFNVIAVPADIEYANSLSDVKPEETDRLFEVGRTRGLTGAPWHTLLPPADSVGLKNMVAAETLANAFERNYLEQSMESGRQDSGAAAGRADAFCSR